MPLQPATKADTYGLDISLEHHPSLGYLPHNAVRRLDTSADAQGPMEGMVIVDGVDGATLLVTDSVGDYVAQWLLASHNRKVAQHMARTLLLHGGQQCITPAWLRAHGWVSCL